MVNKHISLNCDYLQRPEVFAKHNSHKFDVYIHDGGFHVDPNKYTSG